MSSFTYSYIKNISNVSDLSNHLNTLLPLHTSINYNSSTNTLDIIYPSELSIAYKNVLNSLIDSYVPKVIIPFKNLSKFLNYYVDNEIILTSQYQPIEFNNLKYIDRDVFLNSKGVITFLSKGPFIVYGYCEIENGGTAILSINKGNGFVDIDETTIYNKGLLFIPLQDILPGDSISIRAKSDTGGILKYNSCNISIIRSYSSPEYAIKNSYYARKTVTNDVIDSNWLTINYNEVLKQESNYDTISGNVKLIDIGNYIIMVKCSTTEESLIRVLINDVEDTSLKSHNDSGILSIINNVSENSIIKIQVKHTGGLSCLLKQCNIYLINLHSSSTLNLALSDSISPKFLNTYNNNNLILDSKYFKPLPTHSDILRSNIFTNNTVTETGVYLIYSHICTDNTDIKSKLLINSKTFILSNSGTISTILQLQANDTIDIEAMANTDISHEHSRLTILRVEPENIYTNDHYLLYNIDNEIINTNSTEWIQKTINKTRLIEHGNYILDILCEFSMTVENKQFEVRVIIDNDIIYFNNFVFSRLGNILTVTTKNEIFFNDKTSHKIIIEFRTLNNTDICICHKTITMLKLINN